MKVKILLAFAFVPALFSQTAGVDSVMVGHYVLDANYPTLQAACKAAGSTMTLLNSKKWVALTSQALPCNIYSLTGGLFQPASGATVTFSGAFNGDLTRHFDTSPGGAVNLSRAAIAALYPQWFGATCSGDDTAAVQDTYNAVRANQTVQHICTSPISSMVYIPQSAHGAKIIGPGLPSESPGPVFTGSAALIAKSGSSPFQMLRVYASFVGFNNFIANCDHVATNGIALASAFEGVDTVLGATNCTGDGMTINPLDTPATVTTAPIRAGMGSGTSLTVRDTVLPGMTLGADNCLEQMVDAGTSHAEVIEYIRADSTTLKWLSIKPAYDHPVGSRIQCNGNNDSLTLYSPYSQFNAGWGLNIFAQIDGNGIGIYSPNFSFNRAGGDLLAGSGITGFGGHFEGNSGPAEQLGDLTGRSVVYSTFSGAADLESSLGIVDVCGLNNSIQFRTSSEFTPYPAGAACSGDTEGALDLAWGYGANKYTSQPELLVKTLNGTVALEPANFSTPGGILSGGLIFRDTAGNAVNSLQASAPSPRPPVTTTASAPKGSTTITPASLNGIAVGQYIVAVGIPNNAVVTAVGPAAITSSIATSAALSGTAISFYPRGAMAVGGIGEQTTYGGAQFEVDGGASLSTLKNMIGVRTDLKSAYIQGNYLGNPAELDLNPAGGPVKINGDAIGGTFTCPAGQHIASLTISSTGKPAGTCN